MEQEARAAFASEELPFPPVPADLAQRLTLRYPTVFATRDLVPGSAYAIETLLEETTRTQGTTERWAAIGFDGYGTDSRAVHHIVVEPHLAVFVQQRWGGVVSHFISSSFPRLHRACFSQCATIV